MNSIIDKNQKISMSDIENAMNILGSTFSQDFILFLLETNGGMPEKNIYDYIDIDGEKGTSDVLEFLPLFSRDGSCIVKKTMLMREDKRVLPHHIVIGRESGGNLIIQDTSTGKVLLWDHDWENYLPENCYEIGSSFDNFFNESLRSSD
jgi:hypothetical protein